MATFQEQRELWIAAVNRLEPDGNLWTPKTHSLVCSKHFESGRPNPTRSNRDYVPTIFSAGHRPSKNLKALLKKAGGRTVEVKRAKPVVTNTISTQTDFSNHSKLFKLLCCRGDKANEKSTFISSPV